MAILPHKRCCDENRLSISSTVASDGRGTALDDEILHELIIDFDIPVVEYTRDHHRTVQRYGSVIDFDSVVRMIRSKMRARSINCLTKPPIKRLEIQLFILTCCKYG